MPEENLWGPIQEIRSIYDKSYERWMPHVNLIYPFVTYQHFESLAEKAREVLKDFPAFNINLGTFKYFKHKGNCTLWLQPDPVDTVKLLQSKLEQIFPYCNDLSTISNEGYTPHLSVGQFSKMDVGKMCGKFQDSWKNINTEIRNIYFISRINDEPFEIRYTIPLGGGAVIPGKLLLQNPIPTNNPDAQNMFIGNLSITTSEDDLTNFFKSKKLDITDCKILRFKDTGKSRGFGFIHFGPNEDISTIITTYQGTPINGNPIKLSFPRS
jgi:2'-5' RNA ligase